MQNKHILTLLREDYTTVQVIMGQHSLRGFQADAIAHANVKAYRDYQVAAVESLQDPAPWQRTVVNGQPDRPSRASPHKLYTYKAKKSLGLQVGQTVMVERDDMLAFATVVKVHDVPEIDLDAPFDYKWIVNKVDRAEYDRTLVEEANFMQLARAAEREHQRELLKGKFMEHLPADSIGRKLFDEAVAKLQAGQLAAPGAAQ